MSIPMKGLGSMSSVTGISHHSHVSGSSQTLERPKQQTTVMQGSQTLGKTKKSKNSQRLSAGNIEYDNTTSGSQDAEEPPHFRIRSKTVGDTAGIYCRFVKKHLYN
jgi:T-lymphoma invasion and metastasis-inducing protein 1